MSFYNFIIPIKAFFITSTTMNGNAFSATQKSLCINVARVFYNLPRFRFYFAPRFSFLMLWTSCYEVLHLVKLTSSRRHSSIFASHPPSKGNKNISTRRLSRREKRFSGVETSAITNVLLSLNDISHINFNEDFMNCEAHEKIWNFYENVEVERDEFAGI